MKNALVIGLLAAGGCASPAAPIRSVEARTTSPEPAAHAAMLVPPTLPAVRSWYLETADVHQVSTGFLPVAYRRKYWRLAVDDSGDLVRLRMWFEGEGRRIGDPDTVVLQFVRWGTFRELGCWSRTVVQIGDDIWDYYDPAVETKRFPGRLLAECVSVEITLDQAQRIADGEQVQGKVGRLRYHLDDAVARGMKSLLDQRGKNAN